MQSNRKSWHERMYLEYCPHPTKPSAVSSAPWWDVFPPSFHHEDASGRTPVWLLGRDALSPGAFSTHNFSESPNGAVVSSLSDVLEPPDSIPRKYFLSARACAGILRRAEKRGKTIPVPLRLALEAVAGQAMQTSQDTSGQPNA